MTKQLLVFLTLLLPLPAPGESPEQFFDIANQAYQQGKFADAIQKYEQIVQSGVASGELYYNLGNAYYKSGNISKAILNYERALKLMPNDDDLRHNLQLANLMITDKIEPAPRLFIWDWWDAVKSGISLTASTWLWYFFLVMVIAAAILAILAPSYSKRRIAFWYGFAALTLFALSFAVFFGKLAEVKNRNMAIVTMNTATVKNSPDTTSTDAFILHAGVKVEITDKVNQWLKIRLGDGKVGWLQEVVVEII